MTTVVLRRHPDLRLAAARVRGAGLIRAFDLLLAWQERASQRQRLRGLSDHALRDVGLSRADVEGEAAKPFWRL